MALRLPLMLLPLAAGLWAVPACAQQRVAVDASAPSGLAVTVYRDPGRGTGGEMNRDWPQGFAMISETRTVILPPGETTVRFTGVAEGMVAVSAIVTGLPGGTIEKNRNADLLSPASLVDGTLGNRVRVTRTNPATGVEQVDSAVIRTRADGGLVLQTGAGYEAVRCAGLPERLGFDGVPPGLSAQPVFSIDTRDDRGGTYTVTLTYLAWGFDWQANYVATLNEGGSSDDVSLRLLSWLTILNDNNQSFADAQLMAVAGTLNVVSDFQGLSDPPDARPLQLTCYPLGSTATGSPVPSYDGGGYYPVPAPPPVMEGAIMVTAERRQMQNYDSPAAMTAVDAAMLATEEQLGDLKLYRVPRPVTVNAQGLKQVAFLDQPAVEGRFLYDASCTPWNARGELLETGLLFATVNDEEHGLGLALPSGAVAVFEAGASGELLVAEPSLRDLAEGQDVELELGQSSQVMARCDMVGKPATSTDWMRLRATFTNANPAPVTVRLSLGQSGLLDYRGLRTELKDGVRIVEVSVPANGTHEVTWQTRSATAP